MTSAGQEGRRVTAESESVDDHPLSVRRDATAFLDDVNLDKVSALVGGALGLVVSTAFDLTAETVRPARLFALVSNLPVDVVRLRDCAPDDSKHEGSGLTDTVSVRRQLVAEVSVVLPPRLAFDPYPIARIDGDREAVVRFDVLLVGADV